MDEEYFAMCFTTAMGEEGGGNFLLLDYLKSFRRAKLIMFKNESIKAGIQKSFESGMSNIAIRYARVILSFVRPLFS